MPFYNMLSTKNLENSALLVLAVTVTTGLLVKLLVVALAAAETSFFIPLTVNSVPQVPSALTSSTIAL